MPVIRSSAARMFEIPGLRVASLAAPCTGSVETCVWHLTLAPGTPPTPHTVDREEIFVALSGEARLEIEGEETTVANGDVALIPAGRRFSLSNPSAEPFTALAVLPVGGKAALPGEEPFHPPWTL